MSVYPVYDLFDQAGEITLRRDGLYFCIEGAVHCERAGFLHLYAHGENRSEQLGLLIPQGDEHVLRCRISIRRMGEIQNPRFSINSAPYRGLSSPLADGFLPQNALFLQNGENRRIIIPNKAPFEEDVLPFFCFLTPENIEGLPCLTLAVDGDGRPVVPINL